MGIEEFARWYQKKIGTYDKQQWEKTVEEKILHDLTHVHTKTAKPKTEYIDLDLIRGSSFPKAKPKHGLFVVTRLSIQRLLFYPFYGKWWIQQTSSYIFKIFLLFYFLQLIKIFLYFCHWKDKPIKTSNQSASPECDIIIPILIMLVMSFIHSVIVSTNPEQEKRSQRHKVRRKRKKIFCAKTILDENIKYSRHDKIKKKIPNNFIRRNKINQQSTKKTLDEGFESFNGNGSSENGDEKRNSIASNCDEKNIFIEKSAIEDNSVKLKKVETKESISDVGETDTDSEPQPQPEMLIRRRLPKINVTSETDTDSDTQVTFKSVASLQSSRRGSGVKKSEESSCFESDGNEELNGNRQLTPQSNCNVDNDESVSASEWMGVTTNSEDCSYSSDNIEFQSQDEMNNNNNNDQPFWDNDFGPTNILSPSCAPSDLVSCTIWKNNDMKKADLSVLDISSAIIGRGESMPDSLDYFYFCVFFSFVLSMVPVLMRIKEHAESLVQGEDLSMFDISFRMVEQIESFGVLIDIALSSILWQRFVMTIAIMERFFLAMLFFFQLAVAERTFKQRFLYAKLFCHLTSSRKARKSDLPHFRLNKVRNIKTWLSVRSYLKKRGPQRSVDVIVSTSFIVTLLLLSFVSIELVKNSCELNTQYSVEALFWGLFLGVYLLRFMTLGTKIHSKYRNLSVLITEQINLYLQIEQKPHKKDELMVANSVLKLASDLLKELESPFKISGLYANPYLYTITKLVILSALSGVFSEMLGFKLKLHKLKIK